MYKIRLWKTVAVVQHSSSRCAWTVVQMVQYLTSIAAVPVVTKCHIASLLSTPADQSSMVSAQQVARPVMQ